MDTTDGAGDYLRSDRVPVLPFWKLSCSRRACGRCGHRLLDVHTFHRLPPRFAARGRASRTEARKSVRIPKVANAAVGGHPRMMPGFRAAARALPAASGAGSHTHNPLISPTRFDEDPQINSLLWGGAYNPILPVGEDPALLEQWVNLFGVDLLTLLGDRPEIQGFMDAHPYLRTPGHFADEIFFEDWHTKTLDIGVLDILHVIDHYWEAEFRHKAADFKSNCVLVDWEPEDPCARVFAASFGALSDDPELRYGFRTSFEKGLRARVEIIRRDTPLPAALTELVPPLALGGDRLQPFGGSLREDDGIYIGASDSFDDHVTFWNLRAAGTELRYLPYDHIDRFHDFIQAWLRHLDALPSRHPLDRSWIGVHWRKEIGVDVPALMKRFELQRRLALCEYDPIAWNVLNLIPSRFYFGFQSVLANLDCQHGRYSVSFALPDKPALDDPGYRNVGLQYLGAVVTPLVEFDYPSHTLKPPPLSGLNEFLSREIVLDPWKLRTGPEGLALTIQVHDSAETLFPVPHQELVRRVLALVGIKAEPSAAGVLADRIISQMRESRPLDACRVFKIRGVRRLLKQLRASATITWNAALRTIGQAQFDRFKSLYIEPRDIRELTPADVLTYLIKKDILRPRLVWWHRVLRRKKEIRCSHCSLTSVVRLPAFEGLWRCPYCKTEQDLAPRIAKEFRGERAE